MIKRTIRIIIVLVVLALILWGASYFMKPNAEEVASNPCNIDVHALILPDLEDKLKTERQITQAMFDHYFSYYKDTPLCLSSSLKSSKLVSIGEIKRDDPGHFIADIVFDLEPTSMDKTNWISPESSTTTAGWIKNKKGTLSIRTASSTHYLII